MAYGDMVIAHSSVASAASLTIQPGAGVEWLITNLYMGAAWELYRTDGTNTILVESGSLAGSLCQRKLRATNAYYFTLKNTSAGTAYFGYDGVVLK